MSLAEQYLAMVEGLLAMRKVQPLSQGTEAEIAAVHERLWQQITPAEQEKIDPILIEKLKRKWGADG